MYFAWAGDICRRWGPQGAGEVSARGLSGSCRWCRSGNNQIDRSQRFNSCQKTDSTLQHPHTNVAIPPHHDYCVHTDWVTGCSAWMQTVYKVHVWDHWNFGKNLNLGDVSWGWLTYKSFGWLTYTAKKIRSRKETARPQSQLPHSCFCERFIYSHDRSPEAE